MVPRWLIVAGLFPLVAAPGRTATPTLLGDFNPVRVGDDTFQRVIPSFLAGVGPRAVLALGDGDDGSSVLWATDGTAAGTRPVAEFEGPFPELLGVVSGGLLFLHAPDPVGPFGVVPQALWRTDGTIEGTHRLPEVTFPRPLAKEAAALAGSLFFRGCTPETGCELWRSDGTAKGTLLVRDLTPGRYASDPRLFTPSGGRLFFFATNPDGIGLWVSDGTRAGTRRVALLPLGTSPRKMAAAGAGVVFTVAGTPPREALWTSDGEPGGAHPLPPFNRAEQASPVLGEIVGGLGEICLFSAIRASESQLWATDGTVGGTRRLARFRKTRFALDPRFAAALGPEVFFAGPNGELWSTRGTPGTTRRLTGCPGGCPRLQRSTSAPIFAKLADRLLFGGLRNGRHGLWAATGSGRDADLVAELPGAPLLLRFTVAGRLFFGVELRLWVTDGTSEGTRAVTDAIFPAGSLAAPAGPRLAFVSQGPTRGFDLRASDGTAEGSTALVNLERGSGSLPQAFRRLGEKTLFTTCFTGRTTLWITDGAPSSAVPLLEGSWSCSEIGGSRIGRQASLGSEVFFLWINEGEFWTEVWRTDGAPDGTSQVTHLGPGVSPVTVTVFGGRLILTSQPEAQFRTVFRALEGADAIELFAVPTHNVFQVDVLGDALSFVGQDQNGFSVLWGSDGTATGTAPLARLFGAISPLAHRDGVLYFLAGGGFWRSDGTAAGTRQVLPSLLHGGPNNLTGGAQADGFLLLATPQGLFKTDGTAAGTALVRAFDPDPSAEVSEPRLTPLNGRVAFAAADAEHGAELWLSDGTRAGTVLVRDIWPGEQSSGPALLVAAGGRLFFTADDGAHGVELWESDGTFEGTRLVADLAPGVESSFPRDLTVSGGWLFFSAEDGTNGREPWVLEVDEP